jgi:hypothetical protein
LRDSKLAADATAYSHLPAQSHTFFLALSGVAIQMGIIAPGHDFCQEFLPDCQSKRTFCIWSLIGGGRSPAKANVSRDWLH